MRLGLLVGLAVLAGCAAPPARPAQRGPHAHRAAPLPTVRVARPDPGLVDRRLPRTLIAERYRAQLAVRAATLDGTLAIDATLAEATDTLWLDASGLAIRSARARRGAQTVELEPRMIGAGEAAKLALLAAAPLPPGPVVVEIEYSAPIADLGVVDDKRQGMAPQIVRGAFRERFEGRDYVFTMFEPFYARRVFPCLDEPDRRASWTLVLEVAADDVVAGNMPIARETPLPAGRKRVELAPTPALPSYLIAFAVGPFDIVQGASTHGTPIRLFAQHGHGPKVQHAADALAPILDELIAYTGQAFPFPKLDVVAVPLTGVGWTAMENPGVVTASEVVLRGAQPGSDIEWVFTMAHELAHHWFGDVVTMAWWDEIWLNEALATWLTDKLVTKLRPQSASPARDARRVLAIVDGEDQPWLRASPTIRAPLDLSYAFETLQPYFSGERGAAYLAGLEAYVGADALRDLLRTYLDHPRTVTTRDLEGVLRAAGYAIDLQHAIDTPGTPVLSVELACEKRRAVARLASTAGWTLPVCIAFGDARTRTERCVVVTGTTEVGLGATCPRWVSPNASGVGFYRSTWTRPLVDGLLREGWFQLGERERERMLAELAVPAPSVRRPGATPEPPVLDAATALRSAIALVDKRASDPASRAWIASTFATFLPRIPDELRADLTARMEPALARARALDLSYEATSADEQAARTAELELAATLGDPALVARGPALYADLSKIAVPYWPWVRLLAARGQPALVPELLASSIFDNASTLARIPKIAQLVARDTYAPSVYVRLFHRGCSAAERADALAATREPPADVLAKPIDACIAERAALAPMLRAWLRGPRGVGRRR